jgi:uncharacterized membrane protein (GlpM family)
MDVKWLPLYFFLGGVVVALITYFGSHGKGLIAAFVAFFPSITLVTLLSIYFASGVNATVSYMKGAIFLIPSWILYALAIIFILPRWGLVPSVLTGLGIYIAAAFITMRFVH